MTFNTCKFIEIKRKASDMHTIKTVFASFLLVVFLYNYTVLVLNLIYLFFHSVIYVFIYLASFRTILLTRKIYEPTHFFSFCQISCKTMTNILKIFSLSLIK